MDDNTHIEATPEGDDEMTPGASGETESPPAELSEKVVRRRGGRRSAAPRSEAQPGDAEPTEPATAERDPATLETEPTGDEQLEQAAEGEPAIAEAEPATLETEPTGDEQLERAAGEAADGEEEAVELIGPPMPLKLDQTAWEILEERARALARAHDDTEEVLGEEVVVFRLGEGSYSLPARFIREVQPLDNYTPLPSTPAFVVGLVNLRGRLLAALDIRPLLELKHQPPQPGSYLIVVAIGGIEVSLLADAVDEVRHSDTELAPALSASTGRTLGWVRGIDRDLNLVLDPHGLLSDPRLIVNSEA